MLYEIIYLLSSINLIFCGFIYGDILAYTFVLILLTIIGAESAIILSIVVLNYNLNAIID
jgi:NADH:ubiquinone oxidoreductase subunit K